MTEKELQTKLSALLKKNDIMFYKTHGGLQKNYIGGKLKTYMLKKGFPDIMIFHEYDDDEYVGIAQMPITLFVELKSDKGQIRETQIETFNKLYNLGHSIFIMKPCNFEIFKKRLKERPMLFGNKSIDIDFVLRNSCYKYSPFWSKNCPICKCFLEEDSQPTKCIRCGKMYCFDCLHKKGGICCDEK